MTFGHNELWQPLAANSLLMTSWMLQPLATTNYDGLWPQIASLWPFKWSDLPQWTVADPSCNELWCSPEVNNLSVMFQMFCPLATMNCGILRPRIVILWLIKCGLGCYTIWEVIESLFSSIVVTVYCGQRAQHFDRLQKGYSQPKSITICCILRSKDLKNHRKAYQVCSPPQFVLS